MENYVSQDDANREFATKLNPNVFITIGEYTFIMHKSSLVNKSRYLEELIQENSNEENALCAFTLDDFPGGASTFKIIAKFCYGDELELTSSNVVPVICAAHYLDMTSDNTSSNIIFEAENFLSEKVLANWEETIEALISSEEVLKPVDELSDIVSRCIESLAYKVMYLDSCYLDWWFEDVCALNLSLFKRLIEVLGAMCHDPANISNAVAYYADEYNTGLDPNSTGIWSADERKLLEEMISLLPGQKGATSTKYLLSMLCAGIMLNANVKSIECLEQTIGAQLDEEALDDLLAPFFGNEKDVAFDISHIRRIVEHFVDENLNIIEILWNSNERRYFKQDTDLVMNKIAAVGKTIDQYLANVAVDSGLEMEEFQSFVGVIPDGARPSHDALYGAVCAYIEYHPWLCEQQKKQLCRLLDTEKMSRDACKDAILNRKQLPVEFILKVFFVEIIHIGIFLKEEQQKEERYMPKLDLMPGSYKETEWILM